MRLLTLALLAALAAAPVAAQSDTAAHATFHIVPRRPVESLRVEALTRSPPPGLEGTRPADLVELVALDSTIRLDIRYATTNNFMRAAMYSQARAFLQRPAAVALVRVHRALAREGYGLLIHDAYRPWYVTWMFWEATPDSQHTFVADPTTGSRHNRGAAVDLTLFDRATGRPVRMPSGYDEFSARAYPSYRGGTADETKRRDLLRRFMEREGFVVNPTEWWHFDFTGWRDYPVLNVPFERLGVSGR
ncbi:MAG: M15 family metallopeptidase [Gemmatimonadaceae bacterium]|nr:M15 family metallopeptidase [Gemmatimonadaceae bacterium]